MKRYVRRRARAWELFLAGALLFTLIWASSRPSEASESDKTLTEGYKGSERIRLVEKPYKADSEASTQRGYIGDRRIDLKVVRKNEYTETRGWVEGEYIHVRKKKDD